MLLHVVFLHVFFLHIGGIVIPVNIATQGGIVGAANNATAGDVIQLFPGIYSGENNCDIRIIANSVGLRALGGPQNTIIDCRHQTRCLSVIGGYGITISGIQFINGRAPNTPVATTTTGPIRKKLRKSLLPRRRASRFFAFSIRVYVTAKGKLQQEFQMNSPKKTPSRKKQFRLRANEQQDSSSIGGCVLVMGSASVVLSNVLIRGGQALSGSGLGVTDSSINIDGAKVEANGVTINSDDDLFGAGAYFLNSSVVVSNSSFSNNFMNSFGNGNLVGAGLAFGRVDFSTWISVGGCDNTVLKAITVSNNSLFSTNPAGYLEGGGISFRSSSNISFQGPITVSNCSLTSGATTGSANLYGGGLILNKCLSPSFRGAITISNCMLLSASTTGTSYLEGGAMYFENTDNATFQGHLSISNCQLLSNGATGSINLYGGGIFFYFSNNPSFLGSVTISNCSLSSMATAGFGYLVGGAMSFQSSTNALLLGNVTISGNSILQKMILSNVEYSNAPFVPPPLTDDPNYLCSPQTISQTSGSLNDGIVGQYMPKMQCTWLLSPLQSTQAFFIYNISFEDFDTELDYDFLYLYDGSTSLSALIGKYAGSLGTYWKCYQGYCPSLNQPIISRSGQVLLVFTSDDSTQKTGFNLTWTIAPFNRTSGNVGTILNDISNYPFTAYGGGLHFFASNAVLNNISFVSNSISSPYVSLGGGLSVDHSSIVKVTNAWFNGNKVNGISSCGGGLSVSTASFAACQWCSFESNNAIADGESSCIYTSEATLCPSAFGGSIFIAYYSKLEITNSIIRSSTSLCRQSNQLPCSTLGGAIAVIGTQSSMAMSASSCTLSQTTCSDLSSCSWSSGGSVFVSDANLQLNNCKLNSNVAVGLGSGGAISAVKLSTLRVSNSQIINNTAQHGGGLSIIDESTITVVDSLIQQNHGTSIAGGLIVRVNAKLYMQNITFASNIASRASILMSYSDNGLGFYSIVNSTGTVPVGSSWLMLGALNFTNNVWNCSQVGTVFNQDKTSAFFSLTCVQCDAGTYAFENASTLFVDRKCQPCPFGGRCLGSSETSNGLLALGGYWGSVNANGEVAFYPCPINYCCPVSQQNVDCAYNYCQGNRVNRLCGRCRQGNGLRFFTEACISNESCSDAVWFGWVILICAVVEVLFLLYTTGNESTGMLSVLLYFYQVLPFVKSSTWKYSSPTLIIIIQSVFSFSPTGDSNGNGVCLVPSMTTSQKIGSRILLQAVIFATIIVIFFIHSAVYKFYQKMYPAKISHYVATAVRFGTIAYTTLVLVPLQMIQCIIIDDLYVWFGDGSIVCYQGWQKFGFAAIAVLIPLPLAVIVLLSRYWKTQHSLSRKWKRVIWKVLSSGYKTEKRWWLGISLYRRFLMVLVFATITDLNWKALASSFLCVTFLVISQLMQPFKSPQTNISESASLFALTLISMTTAPQLSQMQFRSAEHMFDEAGLEWIQFFLALFPIAGYVTLLAARLLRYYLEKRKVSSSSWEFNNHHDRSIQEIEECPACVANEQNGGLRECEAHQYC